ncbi:MAG: ribose ABC transporter permease, partial [Eubacteriales bacterium]|nr:ribose ABC transporter permease [Eubacteriales bacterium]
IVCAHIISGMLAACAGIMLSARMGAATIDIGDDWMLFSFAAPIIGGTRLAGGKISVAGTVVGAIILASMENGLVHLNIDIYWMELIRGIVILLAVLIDTLRNARRYGGQVS